jgi:hypothetical protein
MKNSGGEQVYEPAHPCKGHAIVKREFSFDFYLNENISEDQLIYELTQYCEMPVEIAEELATRRPFYEVALHCVLDLDTMHVRIERAECSQ